MSRGPTDESWGEALWQEVVLNASVRTILLSTNTDHVLTAERPGVDAVHAVKI